MKIRMRGNSIRLRLTQSESSRLSEMGEVEEVVGFGGDNNFVYAVKTKPNLEEVYADFSDCKIVVLFRK